MSFEQPAARILVHGARVVLVDDVAPFSDALLLMRLSGSAQLDRCVEQIHVRVERELE